MNEELIDQISNILSIDIHEENIEKLHGDASTRTYWRINTQEGSWVISEEEPFTEETDFINISNYLSKHNITVPKIIKTLPKQGIIILQDAGNVLLYHLAKDQPSKAQKQYEQIIDILIRLQTDLPKDNKCVAFKRAFDEAKWLWELEHTENYFFNRLLKTKLSTAQTNTLRAGFKTISNTIDLTNLTFCHRDFHSRNILFYNETLYLIDFQDARLGPPLYDLISILRDCYITLPQKTEQDLIARYKSKTKKPIPNFEEQYTITALQRHLKACGTFAYQHIERKNNFYLQFIQKTWQMILEESKQIPNLTNFHTLLTNLKLPETIQ